MTRVLAVRLDGIGDVVLTGPAVRALAAHADGVDVLAPGPGAEVAALLPGVDHVFSYDAPWTGAPCHSSFAGELSVLIGQLRGRYDEAIVFTSFHQSSLPAAMVCRLAGIARIAGTSDVTPGTLLDVRHHRYPDGRDDDGTAAGGHEVEAGLRLAAAAGYRLPDEDDGQLRLRLKASERDPAVAEPAKDYVVVHGGASVPARALGADLTQDAARALIAAGHHVVLTGDRADHALAEGLPSRHVTDLIGRTDLRRLCTVLAGAAAVVVGNTGAAHLAAAVGTPVVSVFAPVVPAARWRPWGVPHVLLGDQQAPCALTRARTCPIPGHPCLRRVTGTGIVDAVRELTGASLAAEQEASCAS